MYVYIYIIYIFIIKLLETCKKVYIKIMKIDANMIIILSGKVPTCKTCTKVTLI